MASGASSSTGFNFGSDDLLCPYDDGNNSHSDQIKDFRETRIGRSSLNVYNPQEAAVSQEVISTVEKAMKKYADNLLQFLEGISGRLAKLESYCYNLERSVRELHSDLVRDHSETDLKIKSIEKHLQEVHRSLQILRDKQELAETQKELAKLQLAQKESLTVSRSQHKEERATPSTSEPTEHEIPPDAQSCRLLLPAPHQGTTSNSLPPQQGYKEVPVQQPAPPPLLPHQIVQLQGQPQSYYPQQTQLPSQAPQIQPHHQDQNVQAEIQYMHQPTQIPDQPRQVVQPQPLVNQTQTNPFPQFQQQWPQQIPPQVQPQQPSQQAQLRSSPPLPYPPYQHQPTNRSPEMFPSSLPMQVPQVSFSGISQPGATLPEAPAYGFAGPGGTFQQQSPQHNIPQLRPQTSQSGYGAHSTVGSYPGGGPHHSLASMPPALRMYGSDSIRLNSQFQQGNFPPTPVSSHQNQQPAGSVGFRHPGMQLMPNQPYGEMIEKAMSMGFARDQVVTAIQRMEESGQHVDFNNLLDRLNGHGSGPSQRAWSG